MQVTQSRQPADWMARVLATAVVILGIDQLSKWYVVQVLNLREVGYIDVAAPYLTLRMAWNRGMNFGMLADDGDATRWILIGVALAISVLVIWWMRHQPRPAAHVAAGLMIGGAIGNVIDRVIYGAVADFLNMSCCGIVNPYAFNVADIAIFVGAFGLILFTGEKKTP